MRPLIVIDVEPVAAVLEGRAETMKPDEKEKANVQVARLPELITDCCRPIPGGTRVTIQVSDIHRVNVALVAPIRKAPEYSESPAILP